MDLHQIPSEARPSVVLGDDLRMSLDLMSARLAAEFHVVDCVTDARGFCASVEQWRPDIAVIGMTMPGLSRIQLGQGIREHQPGVGLVYLSSEFDGREADTAFRIGALAYLLKSRPAEEFMLGMRAAAQGRSFITPAIPREPIGSVKQPEKPGGSLPPSQKAMDVLTLLIVGFTMKEVARKVGISPSTVAFHKYSAMKKMKLHNKAALVEFAVRQGLIARAMVDLSGKQNL